jgi:hypothetical protein
MAVRPPPVIDGMDFQTEFLRTLIEGNISRLFEMSDDGWNKEGRGAVLCLFGIDDNGNRVWDSESGRGSNEFDFSYISFDKVKEMFGSDRKSIVDATNKYNPKTEAIFIIMIEVKSQITPFIAQLALQRKIQ